MDQKPDPSTGEIEFVFWRILKGMPDQEIRNDMENAAWPVSFFPNYIRRMRCYFKAAKKVLEENYRNFVMEKRREHTALLIEGVATLSNWLETLRNSPYLRQDTKLSLNTNQIGYLLKDLEPPNTLASKCLMQHLQPDDTILLTYRQLGEAVRKYIELCSALHTGQIGYLRKDKEATLLLRIRDAFRKYVKLSTSLDTEIELRRQEQMPMPGHCDVCSPLGEL